MWQNKKCTEFNSNREIYKSDRLVVTSGWEGGIRGHREYGVGGGSYRVQVFLNCGKIRTT